MSIKKILLVITLTALFPWLFYQNIIGINLLIFNILIFCGLYFIGKLNIHDSLNRSISVGTLTTAILVVYNGSDLAITINILSLFLLAGTSLFPKGRNLITMVVLSLTNLLTAQFEFITLVKGLFPKTKSNNKFVRILKLAVIPLVIVFIFILIYKAANPVFEGIVSSFFDALERFFDWLWENIEFSLFITFVFGFLLANIFMLGKGNREIIAMDLRSSDELKPKINEDLATDKFSKQKNEYTSAIILFSMLNLLILIINLIDIWWVWFNFEWDGEYLKQFVHEGTYLLILSIIISLAISTYYFRGGINFIKNNHLLRNLAFVWLAQNAILTISVGIRNYWYINYFSLAYLRIGVVFFLLLTLFSIFTVLLKIKDKKSSYFLFRKNSLAAYVLLVVMAFFNWDVIIAKYNFSHTETAFLHYDFLASLSPNALPYLEKSKAELQEIDLRQADKFEFRRQYITSEEYRERINNKKADFVNRWKTQNWQEWNWAGERTFRKLVDN